MVSYEYDTWGKLLDISGNTTLGVLNPFRYRGYYYDSETGLYYLQSRYYDPEMGRFINADTTDVLEIDQDSLIENNLFAYCLNNPVNMTDDTGELAWFIAAAIGGALFDTAAYMIGCAISGEKMTWAGVGKSALVGAITGVALGGVGKVATKLVKGAVTAVKTSKVAKYTTGTAGQVGKIGEKLAKITKNTKSFRINGRLRIPDGVNSAKRLLQEVKNVKSLSLTTQIKDSMQLAKQWGYTMELYIRPDTYLSGPLKTAIKEYGVKIRYLW